MLGYLIFAMFGGHGGTDSLTISELKEKGEAAYSQQVKLRGRLDIWFPESNGPKSVVREIK